MDTPLTSWESQKEFFFIQNVQIENYDVYFPETLQNPQLKSSRLAVYVHKDLMVKVRTDLMNDTFNSV
jgi:hypothetical protein